MTERKAGGGGSAGGRVGQAGGASPAAPGVLNWVLILVLGMIWGGAFMAVRVALEGFGPLTVAAGRVAIGAGVLTAVALLMGQSPARVPGRRGWVFAALIGSGAVALPFALLAWGQQHVPSAFAGVAMGAVPLLVLPLVAIFSPEEGIGPRRIAGIATGFAGLLVLLGPDALSAFASEGTAGAGAAAFWGGAACLGAAFCYAGGSVLTRRAPAMPPLALASATLLTAAVILVPIALAREGWPRDLPALPSWALLYAAIFPTALAAAIRVRVITTAGSMFMSLTSYMVPVWSVIFGVALLGEALPPTLFLALGLVLGGIGISQSRSLGALLRR